MAFSLKGKKDNHFTKERGTAQEGNLFPSKSHARREATLSGEKGKKRAHFTRGKPGPSSLLSMDKEEGKGKKERGRPDMSKEDKGRGDVGGGGLNKLREKRGAPLSNPRGGGKGKLEKVLLKGVLFPKGGEKVHPLRWRKPQREKVFWSFANSCN